MSSSTEAPSSPPTDDQPDIGTEVADGDDARAHPGRVRGQRLEITPADLTMYSAITGRAPSQEERDRALTWSESDPMHDEIAAAGIPGGGDGATTALSPVVLRPWHLLALSMRIREIWFNGLTIKMARPQVTQWVRRVSLALQQGRRRVRQVR